MPSQRTDILEIKDLHFSYPEQSESALRGVTLKVRRGEFLVLCGASGCGKSTLLRQLKTVLAPHGQRRGEILFEGRPLDTLDQREQTRRLGFVRQNPDHQLVTDKVWHELAFGLESLGCDTPTVRRRVAEMAAFFGVESWFYQTVSELSGGQKQMVNLASVMAMQPDVLILDEPTSQLDPIAASDFLATLGKINRELGTTILLSEHRLEEVFPLASRAAVMDGGRLVHLGTPGEVALSLRDGGAAAFLSMPTAMRVWASVESSAPCPITVGEGRQFLREFAASHQLERLEPDVIPAPLGGAVLEASQVWFRYEKGGTDVVRGLDLTLGKGEFFALLGGNGAGKSTTLKLLAGLLRPYRGEVRALGRIGALPQDPQTLFVKKTVREDLLEVLEERALPQSVREEKLARAAALCRLEALLDRHPYDLSGGEQQRAALAKVLLLDPEILLLDEPTKGLDGEFKQALAEILQVLLRRGTAVLMVSHDIEFCARYAHRCALFFDGCTVAQGTPRKFFSGNSFYTTSANRMARDVAPEAVTAEDVIQVCGGERPPVPRLPEDVPPLPQAEERDAGETLRGLPRWRKLLAVLSGLVSLGLFFFFAAQTDLTGLVNAGGLTALSPGQMGLYGVFSAALLIFAACVTKRSRQTEALQRLPGERKKLPRRTVLAAVLILLLVPATLFFGVFCLGGRKYYFIALLVLLETMLPFFLVFEGRKPQAREVVVIAVLCAIGVAGRAFFFMLPQFKPVTAVTILSGVALGGEAGFLVGAMTMLTSNILFSQGPWTPWQMFAMGLIGLLAGILFRKGWLARTRSALCAFGALSAVLIYGGIMNPAAATMWSGSLDGKIIAAYYISGFPMDLLHGCATWLFLWFGGEPMLEKLDRIKVKYGLVESR